MGAISCVGGYVFALTATIILSLSTPAQAAPNDQSTTKKERLIFVVNTMENDVLGGVSVAYVDEYRWMKRWQKIIPNAKIIRIRANTTSEMTKMLDLSMQPNPEMKEVVALDLHSHGAPMMMLNESADFNVLLPKEIQTTFAPIIGRFAEGAKIVFGGCEILAEQNQTQAMNSLKAIADKFQLRDGYVYANETVGAEGLNAFLVDVWNKDIPWEQRKRTLRVYLAWFITLPAFAYKDRYESNQGYLLEARAGETVKFGRFRYQQNFDPNSPSNKR